MSAERHSFYLDELIRNLDVVGENLKDARWVMKEGIYLRDNTSNYNKLCDLIIGYPGYASLIELKGSRVKKSKAVSQLLSGHDLVTKEMGYERTTMKVVYYSRGGYEYEEIRL